MGYFNIEGIRTLQNTTFFPDDSAVKHKHIYIYIYIYIVSQYHFSNPAAKAVPMKAFLIEKITSCILYILKCKEKK